MASKQIFVTGLMSLLVTGLMSSLAFAEDKTSSKNYRVVALENNWQQIFPGGETTCARGEEFSFFYRPGSEQEVIIDFAGGGACWNFTTCDKETALFIDNVEYFKERMIEKGIHGIYDHDNSNNPLKTWSHVVIPYCTGDLHWGDKVTTYTKDDASVTIAHKGGINAKTVIDWALERHDERRLFLTGTSAGGYASIFWLPYIKERAPNANTVQFSDGAAGIVVKKTFQEAIAAWGIMAHVPTWIPKLDPRVIDWSELSIVDLYTEIGRYYPSVTLSQFNTNADAVQMLFYYVMGGEDTDEWAVKALEAMKRTSTNLANFNYFHGAGEFHTIIPEATFYTFSVNNVKLVDWLQNLLDESNVGNIVCDECTTIGASQPRE